VSKDQIQALIERRQQAWNARDARALTEDHSADCAVDSPLAGGATGGRGAIEHLYATYFRAFTDFRFDQDAALIDGDRVAIFATASGTDHGGFMGMPPTGRAVKVPIVFLYELRDGLIVRDRRVYDFTSVLIQLGILKAKPSK
jgi:steroid delta-isomerase-like uncharacterized protein